MRALVDRIKLEQSAVETLEAAFVQRQESEMLLEPDVSRGTFSYAAPDRVRWEYTDPKPISVVIDGEHMTTWYRDLDRADRVKVGRYSNQVLKYMGASGDFETLLDYFRVRANFPEDRAEPYRITLLPRYERIERRLRSMTIWVDPARFLPVRLQVVGGEGDVTEYRFEQLQVNRGIPAERFRLVLPKSTEVREIALGSDG
ncbi:MAG TPA: outer membrane lipoprotein carrier protein LolA [Thermoanaerobaculia bacterium]|nr:outer membrane lipoprotein carrier protein LolA [Thermoanaerobaculia bacterium]